MKNYRKKEGITLIALVITIVVLLILAGVSINAVFSDNGIIKRASSTQDKMNEATKKDVGSLDTLNGLVNERTGPLSKLKSYDSASKNDDGTVKENTKYKDSESNIAVIPEGYKVSENENEKTISKGLVIKDSDGNEFVWVPVSNINEYVITSWNGEKVKEQATTDEERDGAYCTGVYLKQSILSKNETGIVKVAISNKINRGETEANTEKTSIENYGGFYIGRYEASYDSTNKKLETKKNKTPYTNINMSIIGDTDMADGMVQMSYLDENNVKIQKLGIVTKPDSSSDESENYTLGIVTGLQWDAMIRWINKTNSSNTYNTSGHKGTEAINTGSNEAYKVNNIYDIAGNVSEYVAREYYGKDGNSVYRGANYSSTALSANIRGNTDNIVSDTIGTRQMILIGKCSTAENTSSAEIRDTDTAGEM